MVLFIFSTVKSHLTESELFSFIGDPVQRMQQECIFGGEVSRKSRYLCIPYCSNITLLIGLTYPLMGLSVIGIYGGAC